MNGCAVKFHFRIKLLGGQRVVINETERCLYFRLKKGAYLTAGRKFGWNPPPALGVNYHILEYAIEKGLNVRVFEKNKVDRCYEADPRSWLSLNAVVVRRGVCIYLYPWKWFKAIMAKDDPNMTTVAKIFQEKS